MSRTQFQKYSKLKHGGSFWPNAHDASLIILLQLFFVTMYSFQFQIMYFVIRNRVKIKIIRLFFKKSCDLNYYSKKRNTKYMKHSRESLYITIKKDLCTGDAPNSRTCMFPIIGIHSSVFTSNSVAKFSRCWNSTEIFWKIFCLLAQFHHTLLATDNTFLVYFLPRVRVKNNIINLKQLNEVTEGIRYELWVKNKQNFCFVY